MKNARLVKSKERYFFYECDYLYSSRCRFSHDLEAYLAAKPADIGNRCVNFDLFGK